MPKTVPTETKQRRRDRLRAHLARALRPDGETRSILGRDPGIGTLVASYNVHKCVGTDNRFDPERIAAVIDETGADIIALQEAEQRFGKRSPLLDLQRLERARGLYAVPVVGASSGCGFRGNMLLVREGKVSDVHRIALPGVEPRGALVVDLELKDGPLRIVAAHLGLLRRSRELQAEAILAAVEARGARPTLVVGDLNEWRIGERSALRRFAPAFGPIAATLPSFPSRLPVFALDRILARPHDLIAGIEVHDSPLARAASDHLPIKALIDVAGAASQVAGARLAA